MKLIQKKKNLDKTWKTQFTIFTEWNLISYDSKERYVMQKVSKRTANIMARKAKQNPNIYSKNFTVRKKGLSDAGVVVHYSIV